MDKPPKMPEGRDPRAGEPMEIDLDPGSLSAGLAGIGIGLCIALILLLAIC